MTNTSHEAWSIKEVDTAVQMAAWRRHIPDLLTYREWAEDEARLNAGRNRPKMVQAQALARRAEREVARIFRDMQARGEVLTKGQNVLKTSGHLKTALEAGFRRRKEPASYTPLYDNVASDTFERALAICVDEGNATRVNLMKHLITEVPDLRPPEWLARRSRQQQPRTEQPNRAAPDSVRANPLMRNAHRLNDDRMMQAVVEQADAMTIGLDLIEPRHLDGDRLDEWIAVLGKSLKELRGLHGRLITERDQRVTIAIANE